MSSKPKLTEIAPTSKSVVPAKPVAQLMEAIIRAAGDPNVDIDKFERLMAMQERMTDRIAKVDYDNALAKMQSQLPMINRKGTIVIRAKDPKTNERTGAILQSSKYSKWEDINEAILPILRKHGYSHSFRTGMTDAGLIKVTGVLARGGHREETTIVLKHDSSGSKNDVQAIGSSTSYGKRYTAGALLNITSRGEDDDGKTADGIEPISPAQITELMNMAQRGGADVTKFCKVMGVANVAEITVKMLPEARRQLERKLRAKKRAADKAAASDFPGDQPMKG